MKTIKTLNVKETIDVGFKLGKLLKRGDVVTLNGDLGVGKTAFTSGIAKALGIEDYITSPTFTIVNEYDSDIPLYHFDVYRISDSEELYNIGFEDYLSSQGIIVIEWADIVRDILPKSFVKVLLEKNITMHEDARLITIEFIGDKSKEMRWNAWRF